MCRMPCQSRRSVRAAHPCVGHFPNITAARCLCTFPRPLEVLNLAQSVCAHSICKQSDGKKWLLGEGSYGKVWKAVWTRSDGAVLDVAMKMTIINSGGTNAPKSRSHSRHALHLPAKPPMKNEGQVSERCHRPCVFRNCRGSATAVAVRPARGGLHPGDGAHEVPLQQRQPRGALPRRLRLRGPPVPGTRTHEGVKCMT